MDGATDEEIYKAIIDSKAQREAANDIGDNDVDDDTPIAESSLRHVTKSELSRPNYYREVR